MPKATTKSSKDLIERDIRREFPRMDVLMHWRVAALACVMHWRGDHEIVSMCWWVDCVFRGCGPEVLRCCCCLCWWLCSMRGDRSAVLVVECVALCNKLWLFLTHKEGTVIPPRRSEFWLFGVDCLSRILWFQKQENDIERCAMSRRIDWSGLLLLYLIGIKSLWAVRFSSSPLWNIYPYRMNQSDRRVRRLWLSTRSLTSEPVSYDLKSCTNRFPVEFWFIQNSFFIRKIHSKNSKLREQAVLSRLGEEEHHLRQFESSSQHCTS